MGLCSGVAFSMVCLVLVWTAGAGCVEILGEPTCVSDYLNSSTCQWQMDRAIDCSSELRLYYRLDFPKTYYTCVPKNRASAECECTLQMEALVASDTYQLTLWAGSRLLWNCSFIPYQHVKPKVPSNLLIRANVSNMWLLTWTNPYLPDHSLYSELTYAVSIASDDDPADFRIYNVTYKDTALHLAAKTLRSGASYSARVRALASDYSSIWSDWSAPVSWQNYYHVPLEQRLQLGISISCTIILFVCVSCYFSITKIKKEWWDQIPSPARSPLMSIVIQQPQVPVWGRPCPCPEATSCPRWKTCLTKLLPCFLEHGQERDEVSIKEARNLPMQGPSMSVWCPPEISRTVLWPERTSVVQCVELAQVCEEDEEEEEEQEEQEEKGSVYPSPGSSVGAFLEGRKDIADRLTESLFFDLFKADPGPCSLQDSGLSGLSAPVESEMHWVGLPSTGPQEAQCQPFSSGAAPAATLPHSPAGPAVPKRPTAVTDNPAYRSFQQCLAAGESHLPRDGNPSMAGGPPPSCLQQPEPEVGPQDLHPSCLQPCTPPSGYRGFVQAVEQGAARDSAATACAGQAGYKAFSSVLTGTPGAQDSSGRGACRPFESLAPGAPAAPVPLFTFGLDLEPPHSPPHVLPQDSSLEPGKRGPLPEQIKEPLRSEQGSAVVYSALTCHLCGHLKQCRGQEDRAKASEVTSSPCCGCRCGDKLLPPESPLRTAVPLHWRFPLESNLSSTVSEEGRFPLSPTAPTCLSAS